MERKLIQHSRAFCARWPRVVWVSYVLLVLTVSLLLGLTGRQYSLHYGFIAFWCTGIGLLVLVPRYPHVGLITFVALAYGVPRYGQTFSIMLEMNILNWVCVLSLTGWLIFIFREHRRPKFNNLITIIFIAFITWLLITTSVALFRGIPWQPLPEHNPVQFAQAILMFLLAAQVLGTSTGTWTFAIALCIILSFRALFQGTSGVYLENDIASLLVMAFPLAILGAWAAPRRSTRITFIMLGLNIFYFTALTQNRAAAVAFIAVILLIWWQSHHRWRLLAIGFPISFICALVLVPWGYWDRFRAIWDMDAAHTTAALDRATVKARYDLWEAGWRMFLDHPWFGVGPGNYPSLIKNYLFDMYDRFVAHNNFIHIAAETGVAGLLLYITLFMTSLAVLDKIIKTSKGQWTIQPARMIQASLVAHLIAGLFQSRHDMVLAYILLGWTVALQNACLPGMRSRQTAMQNQRTPVA